MIPFPYEDTPEFISRKGAIQAHYLQEVPGRHASPTEEKKFEACCTKLLRLAELHWDFLRARPMSKLERRDQLREAVRRECLPMMGTLGRLYPPLEIYRDSFLKEMAGNRGRKTANPGRGPSPERAEAISTPANSAELDLGPSRKGDPTLLGGETAVSFKVADAFLGITSRARQKAVKGNKLDVIGKGHFKMITVESLLRYVGAFQLKPNHHEP